MGDPKRIRKKYDTPNHPWIKSRIDEEKRISKEFGTKSKKEIWKADTILKNFKTQAKKLISLTSDQAEIEKQHLFRRVKQLGLVEGEASFDAVLGLKLDDIMARRLQSILVKKELARTVNQARQFIVHEHVLVGGKKITSPSYLVSLAEENDIAFAVSSSLYSEEHPERAIVKEKPSKKAEVEEKPVEKEPAKKAPVKEIDDGQDLPAKVVAVDPELEKEAAKVEERKKEEPVKEKKDEAKEEKKDEKKEEKVEGDAA